MLEKLLDQLLESLKNGNWLLVIAIVAIAVVVNLRSISEFLDRRSSRREDFVKGALAIEAVRDAARSFLEEELNYLIFKKITGIPADKNLREKIRRLIEQSNGELQIFHFSRTRKLLKMKNGKLSVKPTGYENFEYYFNWFAAVTMAVLASLVIMLLASIPGQSLRLVAILIGIGAILFFFALFLIAQTVPVSVAKKIGPIIDEMES